MAGVDRAASVPSSAADRSSIAPTAYPYHLFDAPMIKTYINAYAGTPDAREAIMEKLMGRSAFTGKSPIDPFCGREDTKQ